MSIGEQAREYMRGWRDGTGGFQPTTHASEDYVRGYTAGRAAYLAAEQAERERLEHEQRCPTCGGSGRVYTGEARGASKPCDTCHGTGRRGA